MTDLVNSDDPSGSHPHARSPDSYRGRGRGNPSRGKLHFMEIGAAYPQHESGGDPVLGAVHAYRTPQLTGPYDEHDPFHDPFVMFGYLAAITERIRFVNGVLVLPQR